MLQQARTDHQCVLEGSRADMDVLELKFKRHSYENPELSEMGQF